MDKQSESFHVILKCTAKEDRLDEFHKLVVNYAIVSRKEPECIRFDVCRDREDKCTYHVYELYTSEAAF